MTYILCLSRINCSVNLKGFFFVVFNAIEKGWDKYICVWMCVIC